MSEIRGEIIQIVKAKDAPNMCRPRALFAADSIPEEVEKTGLDIIVIRTQYVVKWKFLFLENSLMQEAYVAADASGLKEGDWVTIAAEPLVVTYWKGKITKTEKGASTAR